MGLSLPHSKALTLDYNWASNKWNCNVTNWLPVKSTFDPWSRSNLARTTYTRKVCKCRQDWTTCRFDRDSFVIEALLQTGLKLDGNNKRLKWILHLIRQLFSSRNAWECVFFSVQLKCCFILYHTLLYKFLMCNAYTYVMRKVRIGTIWGLSCANLGSKLCANNLQIGHILAHTLFHVWHVYANWMMAYHCCRAADENPFPIDKEGWEKIFNTRVDLHQIYVQKRTVYRSCSAT